MQSVTLTGAMMLAATLMAGCDPAKNSLGPTGDTRNALAFAAGGVDPNTLIPLPPPGADCRADGQWIICHTSLVFAPVNEPSDELACGLVYQTGTDERRGIRWYNSEGLLAKRFVTQDQEFTWSLSPTGVGPLVTLSAHANWRNDYAVPGDESTGPQVAHGDGLTIRQAGAGVIVHIAGLDEVDGTHHGVARFFDDPAVAAALCAALTS